MSLGQAVAVAAKEVPPALEELGNSTFAGGAIYDAGAAKEWSVATVVTGRLDDRD